MIRERRLRPGVVLTATIAGFVLAHALDYAAVFPDPAERASELHRTGHAYLSTVSGLAWPLLGLGIALALTRAAGRSRRVMSARAAVALLAGAQSAFFVTAEIGERVAAHEPLTDLVRTPLLLAGLVTQVGVAALLVALLGAAAWLGHRYVLTTPRQISVAAQRLLTPYVSSVRPRLATGTALARAPPR